MTTGRVMGIDPGERRVGIALSDPLGIIAQPHAVLDRSEGDLLGRLRGLVEEHEVTEIVVGLPVSLSGTEGAAAVAARQLATSVQEQLGLPVRLHDERFTTVEAERALLAGDVKRSARRTKRDMVAAAVLLPSYLDSRSTR
jgi:putative Holliday junction resolvase